MKSIHGIEPTGYTLTKEQWDILFDKFREQEDTYNRLSKLSRNILLNVRGFTIHRPTAHCPYYPPLIGEIVLDLLPLTYDDELLKELKIFLGCPI